jgi:hypothetical protein
LDNTANVISNAAGIMAAPNDTGIKITFNSKSSSRKIVPGWLPLHAGNTRRLSLFMPKGIPYLTHNTSYIDNNAGLCQIQYTVW